MPKQAIPAAQYIRMSTEHQRFSPDNQKTAIAAYALANGFEVVATYQDSGKSGLTLSGRPELKRLLSDVLSGAMPYKAILVLDVSRWGRFQDADQAAHYEYMCREAGVPVSYCCEAFDNDGGSMAAIVKHMKRVMAAEYSRELSTKVARAQRQQARLGYKQGAPAVIGTRRQVVDENGRPRMILLPGQYKGLLTDRVVYVKGPRSETNLVRKIFDLYVHSDLKISEVAKELNRLRKPQPSGQPWDYHSVQKVLENEIYVGTYVFGRKVNNLGSRGPAPAKSWVRSRAMDPIIPEELFKAAASKRRLTKSLRLNDEELLSGLTRLLKHNGYISGSLIESCQYLPGPAVFYRRFGGLRKACKLIGYDKPLTSTTRRIKAFTDDELLDSIRNIYRDNGKISKTIIDASKETPSSTYYGRRFGGLLKLYNLAGIRPNRQSQKMAYTRENGECFSAEELLDLVRQVYIEHGYLSGNVIDAHPGCPSAWYYAKIFGSLLRLYDILGLPQTRGKVMEAAAARRWQRQLKIE